MRQSPGKMVLNKPLVAALKGEKNAGNPLASGTLLRVRSSVLLKTDLPGHNWSVSLS